MADRLTVLQLLPALEGGGVERGTLEVARALVEAGHRSLVVSAGGRMVEQLTAGGSEHLQWDIGRKHPATLRWVLPLRRLLREQQIDIVHVRSRVPAWVLELALRGMVPEERPVRISTVHGLYSVSRYSAIMTRADRVIAVSGTVRDYIRQHYPDCPEERIAVIPRGVDPAEFPRGHRPSAGWRQQFFEQFPAARDRQLLTLPGRLTRLKGHHDFIDLVGALVAEGRPVHGLIVGGEDPRRRAYAEELRRKVQQQGLSRHVSFTGSRSDIRDIYAISDIVFSLSTKPESFGRTTLEALTLGVPVVGYDHGGVGEILAALYPAGRVPLGDLAALRRTTARLLESPGEIRPNTHFTLDRMLAQTLRLYRQALPARPARGL
ncbi:MAG: glycosyltransferase [Gammaproteobacteria bacterium]|nr:MAG: glycosyltransferase [Gammaproteobacteria bacterium]